MMYTDKIRIHRSLIDTIYNVVEEDSYKDTKAYVENYSGQGFSYKGQLVIPSYIILLPPSISISLQDTISILKMHGTDPTEEEEGEKQISKISRIGGSSISHIEVYV